MKLPVYLDNHSTTPLDRRVLDEMLPYMTEKFGNPSSMDHTFGHDASVAVENAREKVANLVGARYDEIVFTSGATEADNMALRGIMERYADRGNHIVTCATEHKAVLDTVMQMERAGKKATYLPVNKHGMVDIGELEDAITPETVLVSIMAANNEIGTIPDMREIGEVVRRNGALFHTDAAQAVGHIAIDVNEMNIDAMSISSHKMYGPKGIGALYVRGMRPAVRLQSIITGGGQERNLRSGTLNVPGIVGFGRAAELARHYMSSEGEEHQRWTRYMLEKFSEADAILNGHPTNRLPHNLNVRFPEIEGKAVINSVSDRVAISAGSACTTQVVEPSHVLLALGLTEDQAHQSIRFGLGRFTTRGEIEFAADIILEAVQEIVRSSDR